MSEPPATPPDDGALEIRRLLTAPNPALRRAGQKLAKSLPRGLWMDTRPQLHLAVDPAVVEAIKELRSAYRVLWGRIDAVDTDNHIAKRHVLEAIDLLTASFVLLLESTRAGSRAAFVRQVQNAQARQARGAEQLKQAYGELA